MTVGGTGRVDERPWDGYIDKLKTVGAPDEPVARLHEILAFLCSNERHQAHSPFVVVLDVKDDQSLLILDELKAVLSGFPAWHSVLKIYLGVWRQDFALHARQVFSPADGLILTLIADEVDLPTVQSSLYDAFNLDVERVTEEIVQEAAKLGKDVLLWTCNSEDQIKRAKALNIQGILTDNPLLINWRVLVN